MKILSTLCRGGLAGEFFDVVGVDEDCGAAKEGEADDEGVGAVGVFADFAFESAEAAADHAHVVVDAEGCRDEFDGALGLSEHETHLVDFGVADDGHGLVEPAGVSRAVYHEAVDAGVIHDVAAHFFGALHEHYGGDDNSVDELASAVFPHSHFFLCGDIAFHVDFLKVVSDGFFVSRVDDGHEPFAV